MIIGLLSESATVDPAVLSASNGFKAADCEPAGTSKPPKGTAHTVQAPLLAVGLLIVTVVVMLGRAL
jgi:hypothetical protein